MVDQVPVRRIHPTVLRPGIDPQAVRRITAHRYPIENHVRAVHDLDCGNHVAVHHVRRPGRQVARGGRVEVLLAHRVDRDGAYTEEAGLLDLSPSQVDGVLGIVISQPELGCRELCDGRLQSLRRVLVVVQHVVDLAPQLVSLLARELVVAATLGLAELDLPGTGDQVRIGDVALHDTVLLQVAHCRESLFIQSCQLGLKTRIVSDRAEVLHRLGKLADTFLTLRRHRD